MQSLIVILSLAATAMAVPKLLLLESIGQTQASQYTLKTDHPVYEPAPIIKGVPQPYAVPVPQPYEVPRPVPVVVPRAVPYTVTRTVPVPVIARGEPIVRTRVIRTQSNDGLRLGGLSLGGDGGYGDGGYGLGGGYGGGYGGEGLLLGGKGGLSLGLSDGLDYSKGY